LSVLLAHFREVIVSLLSFFRGGPIRHGQPARDFLVRTTILDRFCGPLADDLMKVGGRVLNIGEVSSPTSQAMLDTLDRMNLF
jgi:hypothetical protein